VTTVKSGRREPLARSGEAELAAGCCAGGGVRPQGVTGAAGCKRPLFRRSSSHVRRRSACSFSTQPTHSLRAVRLAAAHACTRLRGMPFRSSSSDRMHFWVGPCSVRTCSAVGQRRHRASRPGCSPQRWRALALPLSATQRPSASTGPGAARLTVCDEAHC